MKKSSLQHKVGGFGSPSIVNASPALRQFGWSVSMLFSISSNHLNLLNSYLRLSWHVTIGVHPGNSSSGVSYSLGLNL